MTNRETCSDCGKPLGSTIDKCHECGGKTYRGGRAERGLYWKMMLGVYDYSGGDE